MFIRPSIPLSGGAEGIWQSPVVPDLVIDELHVNALAAGQNHPCTLEYALDLLPYLGDLGVNAVEFLPMCEFSGGFG